MISGWKYSENKRALHIKCNEDFGCVYVVKIKVIQGVSLLKIGATRMPRERLSNFPMRCSSIFCVSTPHLNFFENEAILHDHFSAFRIPSRPNSKSRPELFNMSLTYFFQNLPDLNLITDKRLAKVTLDPVYGKFYTSPEPSPFDRY